MLLPRLLLQILPTSTNFSWSNLKNYLCIMCKFVNAQIRRTRTSVSFETTTTSDSCITAWITSRVSASSSLHECKQVDWFASTLNVCVPSVTMNGCLRHDLPSSLCKNLEMSLISSFLFSPLCRDSLHLIPCGMCCSKPCSFTFMLDAPRSFLVPSLVLLQDTCH